MTIHEELLKPFPVELVKWRVGSTTKNKEKGMCLAYVDARDVMRRLDEAVGWDGWCTKDRKDGDTYYCELSVMSHEGMITKTGAAGATDYEAEKGGASDAFKRAAVLFGIGRYLYDLGNTWVEIKPQGKSYTYKATEQYKLDAALTGIVKPPEGTNPITVVEEEPLFDSAVAEYAESLKIASDLESLQSIFKEVWESKFSAKDKEQLQGVYEERKAALQTGEDT